MIILGISFGYHDSSVAIVKDGDILVAADEERFSRIKHDNAFPSNAVNFCLEFVKKDISEIDKIVYYENPYKKINRVFDSVSIQEGNRFADIVTNWINDEKFDPIETISKKLNIKIDKITYTQHHLSHASAAFYCSTMRESAVVTIDGVGEYETLTILHGIDNKLKKIKSLKLPNSLGLFYSAFTSFLGFEVNEGEYKVMGMASYGEPKYLEKIEKTIKITENGEFLINEDYFDFTSGTNNHLREIFYKEFGKSRDIKKDFFITKEDSSTSLLPEDIQKEIDQNCYYADIAASVQTVLETIVLNVIEEALRLTASKNLCFSGGVALNATANGKIKKYFKLNSLFIQPASGDSGNALGAALYYSYNILKLPRSFKKFTPFLGKAYLKNDVLEAIDQYMIDDFKEFSSY